MIAVKKDTRVNKILRQGLALMITAMLCVVSASATINVTFVNEPIKEPDLFISKIVTSAVEGYETPEDTFTFFLKVNGSAYKDEYYFLSTNGGPYEEYDAEGTAYQTDRYGRFYLKAGQTAKFPYIGQTASYEVTEEEIEGYLVQPASGKITGTMQGMAAAVKFVNVYVPVVDRPGEETDFRVYKNVIFPDGLYTPEGEDFSFILTLDGEPYMGEKYTVYETKTELLVEERFTDGDGQFTLKGGQYAVFENVLASMDYRVEEVLPSGSTWHTVGSTVQQGSTTYPMTRIEFTNVEASLAVEKVMQDNVPAGTEKFTFTLTNSASRNMGNVPFYLYSSSGNRLDDEIHHTDENGQFELEANQVAVLLGITPNTTVSVKEEPKSGYDQVTPGSAGHKDIPVGDFPGTYQFVNKVSQQKGALTVIKTVQNVLGVDAPESDAFNFVLEKETETGYEPVADAIYNITDGESQYSYKTEADGSFSLKANQRAVFEFLEVGAKYKVTENLTGLSKAYTCTNEGMDEEAVLTTEGAVMIFSNQYQPNLVLNIHKVDFADTTVALEGVEFQLYSDRALTNMYASGKTDAEGNLTFNNLSNGTWYLVESQTVGKYNLPVSPFVLTINYTYPNEEMTASINGGATVLGIDGNTVNVQIKNSTNILWTAILPLTGGQGTYAFTLAGTGLLLAAGYMLMRKKKEMA